MTLLDWEWKDEMLLYPVVKHFVAGTARCASWGFVLMGGSAALALVGTFGVLASDAAWLPWCFFGGASLAAFLSFVLTPLLYIMALWCHHTLLAGRGLMLSRWAFALLLPFAFLLLICELYFVSVGEELLANQYALHPVLLMVLAVAVLSNMPAMTAAPLPLRVRIGVAPCLLVVAYLTGGELGPLMPLSFLCLFAASVLLFKPIRQLAHYAPLVVGLPPRSENQSRE